MFLKNKAVTETSFGNTTYCIISEEILMLATMFYNILIWSQVTKNSFNKKIFYRNFSLVLQLFFFFLANLLDGRYGHKIHHFINRKIYIYMYLCIYVCGEKEFKTLPRTLNEEHFETFFLLNVLFMLKYFTYIFKETGFIVVPCANSTIAIWKYTLVYFSVTLTIQKLFFCCPLVYYSTLNQYILKVLNLFSKVKVYKLNFIFYP